MRNTALLLALVLSVALLPAQAPQKVNYQGVARTTTGAVIPNHAIGIRASILNGSPQGPVAYTETHIVTTNQLGLFTMAIGSGIPQEGTFAGISWSSGEKYLQIEIDPDGGNSYSLSGVFQLLSVPYSLQSRNTEQLQGREVATTPPANGEVLKWNGITWAPGSVSGQSSGWQLTGNAGTDPATHFIGTTDDQPLVFRINNDLAGKITSTGNVFLGHFAGSANTSLWNTGIGDWVLKNNTSGFLNTAMGANALQSNDTGLFNTACGAIALRDNISGGANTAVGCGALVNNMFGDGNTAIGGYALADNTEGDENTAVGFETLKANASGSYNTAVGREALKNNTEGDSSTCTGYQALFSNTTGVNNIAFGAQSLYSNTSGYNNSAAGFQSLYSNTTGFINTASGIQALFSNTSGNSNTAIGQKAMYSNTTGGYNTAIGGEALFYNISGSGNNALGTHALSHNTTGSQNTAMGLQALFWNSIGEKNSAFGYTSMHDNNEGYENTALGYWAMYHNLTGYHNLALGANALCWNNSGFDNTAVGYYSGPSAAFTNLSNTSTLGAWATVTISDKIRLGNSNVTKIEGQVPFSTPSDARFKFNVAEDVKGLDFIRRLRPVNYQFDTRKYEEFLTQNMPDSIRSRHFEESDFSGSSEIVHTGFIAQEVEQAARECGYAFDGVQPPQGEYDNYSIAYSQFVVPLVKAVQEQQDMIEQLQQENAALKAKSEKMEAALTVIMGMLENVPANK